MSTDDRSEENRTMDEAEAATTEDTVRLGEAVSPTVPQVAPAATPETEVAPEPSYARPASTTAYRSGPAIGTILLGLLCLAVAGFAFADRTLDLSVDWARVGPLGVLFGGAVLVLLGVLGMRRRRDS